MTTHRRDGKGMADNTQPAVVSLLLAENTSSQLEPGRLSHDKKCLQILPNKASIIFLGEFHLKSFFKAYLLVRFAFAFCKPSWSHNTQTGEVYRSSVSNASCHLPCHTPASPLCAPNFPHLSSTRPSTQPLFQYDNEYTSNDLFPIHHFLPMWKHFKVFAKFEREESQLIGWSPNRYSPLLVSRLSPLPSTSSSQEITSTASFTLCPCFTLTFTGQSPNITSRFAHTSFARPNILIDTSTSSPTYFKWKHGWSQSLCCSYRRWGSRTGCKQRNTITFIGRQGDFLIALQLVS